MNKLRTLTFLLIITLLGMTALLTTAQEQVIRGTLSAGNASSTNEICATNGTDFVQVYAIRVDETAEYALSTRTAGSSNDGNWYVAMLTDTPEFTTGDYLMATSSYGDRDMLELDAETEYYLHVMGCSFLEQQTYPMRFSITLDGTGIVARSTSVDIASRDTQD